MLFRSIFIITILVNLICFVFVRSEQTNSVSIHHSKTKLPSMNDEEASQWLSIRNVPRRWRHQHIHLPSKENDQTLKMLQALNDNGVRHFDTQSFEGVAMEVIFEMVHKQR